MVTPKQFAEWLKRSTLNPGEQKALLDQLHNLSPEQIFQIAKILKKDVSAQHRILADVERKRDKLLLQFNLEVGKLEPPEV